MLLTPLYLQISYSEQLKADFSDMGIVVPGAGILL
jgi:hypothetical protein